MELEPTHYLHGNEFFLHLIDFGISKQFTNQTTGLTTQFGGTEGFIAPEKHLNKSHDTRSDLYSLGMLLACMFLRKPPQEAISLLDEDFELKPGLFKGKGNMKLPKIIRKLVKCKPSERYQNTNEVKKDLLAKNLSKSEPSRKPKKRSNSSTFPSKMFMELICMFCIAGISLHFVSSIMLGYSLFDNEKSNNGLLNELFEEIEFSQ